VGFCREPSKNHDKTGLNTYAVVSVSTDNPAAELRVEFLWCGFSHHIRLNNEIAQVSHCHVFMQRCYMIELIIVNQYRLGSKNIEP